jgi:hypothetical protein
MKIDRVSDELYFVNDSGVPVFNGTYPECINYIFHEADKEDNNTPVSK